MTTATARIQRPTTEQAASLTLKVRFNHILDCWEVYTYRIGARHPKWRWFQIEPEIADWYVKSKKAQRVEDVNKPENNDDNPL